LPGEDRVPLWIGYVAYDAAWSPRGPRGAEPRLPRDAARPVAWFGRYDAVVAFDLAAGAAFLVGDDPDAVARLGRRIAEGRGQERPPLRVSGIEVDSRERHAAAIARALEHIAAGDIYQVNLARRWCAELEGDAMALAAGMRRASPVPFGAAIDAGDHAVVTRTMERFLRWEGPGGRLETRPIKGTIARHGGDDAREAGVLRADPKEHAEHAMIVDLMRNDLSRVAEIGTVRVEEAMVVEPYAKLSHLVSTVSCTTRADVTLADLLAATFPPGSVTGTPKVRAIEIIEALEAHPRGAYCGAIGYVDRAGGCSFAVAIRTAQIGGGRVTYHAGGGIVAASVIEREIQETELKARAFLDAVG
jgi:anthranilate synthase component 1